MFFRHAIAVSIAMFLIALSVGVVSIALLYHTSETARDGRAGNRYRISALESEVKQLKYRLP